MKKYFDIGRQYDSITDGWRYIFGDNFHLGYFKTPEDNLDRATDNLIDELASLCKFGTETRILDAGCGIGAPATYLYNKFGSDITGVSISKKGIDVIWIMESSHLVINKALLFDECYRLLRPGGHILLSDVLSNKEYNFVFKLKNIFKLVNMIKTFGGGRVETPERYIESLRKSGFKNIFFRDISKGADPTLNYWGKNIIKNRNILIKVFNEREIKRFEKSIETFKYLFREGFKCYYLFRAEK